MILLVVPAIMQPRLPGEAEVQPDFHVQGGQHQAQIGGENAGGRQCTGIAAMAVVFAVSEDPITWNLETMNAILSSGTRFYTLSCEEKNIANRYLEPTELRSRCQVTKKADKVTVDCDILVSERFTGNTALDIRHFFGDVETGNGTIVIGSIYSGLRQLLGGDGMKAVLVVSYDVTLAIWKLKDSDKYWLFDSHARDKNGKIDGNGKSFCGRYSSLQDVCRAFYQNHRDESGAVKGSDFALYEITVHCTNHLPDPRPVGPRVRRKKSYGRKRKCCDLAMSLCLHPFPRTV